MHGGPARLESATSTYFVCLESLNSDYADRVKVENAPPLDSISRERRTSHLSWRLVMLQRYWTYRACEEQQCPLQLAQGVERV